MIWRRLKYESNCIKKDWYCPTFCVYHHHHHHHHHYSHRHSWPLPVIYTNASKDSFYHRVCHIETLTFHTQSAFMCDYSPVNHTLSSFRNRDRICLLGGTNFICKYDSGKSNSSAEILLYVVRRDVTSHRIDYISILNNSEIWSMAYSFKLQNHFTSISCTASSVLNQYGTSTDMRRLTMGIHSEKGVVRRFRRCANVIECT